MSSGHLKDTYDLYKNVFSFVGLEGVKFSGTLQYTSENLILWKKSFIISTTISLSSKILVITKFLCLKLFKCSRVWEKHHVPRVKDFYKPFYVLNDKIFLQVYINT